MLPLERKLSDMLGSLKGMHVCIGYDLSLPQLEPLYLPRLHIL